MFESMHVADPHLSVTNITKLIKQLEKTYLQILFITDNSFKNN